MYNIQISVHTHKKRQISVQYILQQTENIKDRLMQYFYKFLFISIYLFLYNNFTDGAGAVAQW